MELSGIIAHCFIVSIQAHRGELWRVWLNIPKKLQITEPCPSREFQGVNYFTSVPGVLEELSA